MWKIILERLYRKSKIDEVILTNCVKAGKITETEKNEIILK